MLRLCRFRLALGPVRTSLRTSIYRAKGLATKALDSTGTGDLKVIGTTASALDKMRAKPYHLSAANVKSLKLLAQLNLYGNDKSSKPIILSAPHTGSTSMVIQTCVALAEDLDAELLVMDYQFVLKIIAQSAKVQDEAAMTTSTGEKPITLKFDLSNVGPLSKAFAPGQYHIEDGIDDDEDNNNHDDEDDFEDEEQPSKPSFPAFPFRFSRLKKVPPHMLLNFNVTPVIKPGEKESPPGFSQIFNLANLSLGGSNPLLSNVADSTPKIITAYGTELSDDQINFFLTTMHDNITMHHASGESKRFVLLLKDTTDILEHTRSDSGKKLFSGLLDLVSRLQEAIPTLFIVSCTPSLVDYRNIDRSSDFYAQMIDGSLPNLAKPLATRDTSISIAADGTLFNTPLDLQMDRFEKIQLLPPAVVYRSLQDSATAATTAAVAVPSKGNITRAKQRQLQRTEVKRQFDHYLHRLENDLKLEVAESNATFIENTAAGQGLTIAGPVIDFLKARSDHREDGAALESTTLPTLYKEFVSTMMTARLWPRADVERLVLLARGVQLDESIDHVVDSKLTLTDLAMGMHLIYETDLQRCPPIDGEEKEVTPAHEGDDGEGGKVGPLVKNATPGGPSTPLQAEVKKGQTAQQDHDWVATQLKKRGVKLNTHEKRLLTTVVNPASIKVSFSDLILPPSTKLVLQTLITLPLLRPDFFTSGILSRSSINGVLLFGPPGTGKTMLAKAVAKSSGAWFMSVALSDVFDKYVGEGEKNVRAIFSLARKLGGPVVIFLDEVDAVFGMRKGDGSGSSRREVMNEFMSEWDGLMSQNHGVIVLGATNRPFDLDDAILRRMPRRILVDLPNEAARAKILASHLRGEVLAPDVNLDTLAKATVHYSGSDLRNVCISAALSRIKESIIAELDVPKDEETSSPTISIQQRLESIDDWGAFLAGTERDEEAEEGNPLMPINQQHFDIGLKECPPSLSDEMQTLVELRKWDGLYGDGAAQRKGKPNGIGFDLLLKQKAAESPK